MRRSLRTVIATLPTIAEPVSFAVLCGIAVAFGLRELASRDGYLSDFGTFVLAARAMAEGRDPYIFDPNLISGIVRYFDPDSINLNAPLSLVFLAPLAHADPFAAFGIWFLISLLLYVGSVATLIYLYRRYITPCRLTIAAGIVGLWFSLLMGQIYIAMLAVIVIIRWLFARDRQVLAGLLIGLLIAIKPQFAVWPALLFVAAHRRAAFASLVSALALGVMPVAIFGPNIYQQWLEATARKPTLDNPLNVSLFAAASRIDAPWLGIGLSVLLLTVLAGWAWRYHPDPLLVGSAAIVAVILAGPTGWLGTLVWLLPIYFARRWTEPFRLSALMLLFPGEPIRALTYTWPGFGFIYTLALVFLLAGILRGVKSSGTLMQSVSRPLGELA